MNNPLDILRQFSPQASGVMNAVQSGSGVLSQAVNRGIAQDQNARQGALAPVQLQQQQELLKQQQLQNQGLEQEQNIKNTINRLQILEQQIGAGATPEQLAGTLQSFMKESEANGGNSIDSQQAMQALQQGGIEGLSNVLGQAKQVFQQQGFISTPALSEERKLDILGQQKLELETLKGEQDITLAELKASFDAEPDKLKQADALRKEVTDINKRLQFDDTKSAFGRIQASNDGSAAGDLALIFNYMKMLDPGSTVREGEFATAQNAQGVAGRISSLYNQILSGERMTEAQRKEFTGQAEKIFKQSTTNFKQAINPILNIGKSRELTQDNILGEGFFESLVSVDANPVAEVAVIVENHPQYGTVTEDDIAATMQANNMTREQVLNQLGL